MLVISELSEALEADRNGRRGDLLKYVADTAELCKNSTYASFQPATFQELVKDSVGDELADAYIRLCDIISGFELNPAHVDRARKSYLAPDEENFGAYLLIVTLLVANRSSQGHISKLNTGEALAAIEALCAREGIDLATHIDLKLKYNATRGHKHSGKAY